MSPTYDHPRPAVTVDVVLHAVRESGLDILLIRRKAPPHKGRWALPGGFLDMDEELEAAARRELREETGLRIGALEELGAYGKVGRDPRGRTVSVVFLALHRGTLPVAKAGDDASETGWFPASRLPPMAFDHRRIIRDARRKLERMTGNGAGVLRLLPRRFTIPQVLKTYEAILERTLEPRSFRRRILRQATLKICGGKKRRAPVVYQMGRVR